MSYSVQPACLQHLLHAQHHNQINRALSRISSLGHASLNLSFPISASQPFHNCDSYWSVALIPRTPSAQDPDEDHSYLMKEISLFTHQHIHIVPTRCKQSLLLLPGGRNVFLMPEHRGRESLTSFLLSAGPFCHSKNYLAVLQGNSAWQGGILAVLCAQLWLPKHTATTARSAFSFRHLNNDWQPIPRLENFYTHLLYQGSC